MEKLIHDYSCELKGLDFTYNDYSKVKNTGLPLILTLYTKGVCNVKCPSCFINTFDKKYTELNLNDYNKIIEEAKALGIKTIKISGAGEPLIVKETLEIIKKAHFLGINVVLYTNGSSIANSSLSQQKLGFSSNELISFLKKYNVSIVYKFNSIDDSIQDYMVGVKNYSVNIYAGLFKLIYFGLNKEKRLAIQTIMTPYNYEKLQEMYKFCREYAIIPYFETVLKKEKAKKNHDLYLSNKQIKEIFIELSKYDKENYNKKWFPIPSFIGFQCTEIKYGILINNFGYAQVCPGISKTLGNIKDSNLYNIWNSDQYKRIRKSIENLEGKCNTCNFNKEQKCSYGCRAYAYLNTGKINGEYSECWY
ncbi:radical SAM protein [Fusobacterium animalis]|uniref:radical SAM protein n=1 Tax=Fusobacterium animalis TaxID=76859 RepID=UPI00356244C1